MDVDNIWAVCFQSISFTIQAEEKYFKLHAQGIWDVEIAKKFSLHITKEISMWMQLNV
jgi:hypothetical protein